MRKKFRIILFFLILLGVITDIKESWFLKKSLPEYALTFMNEKLALSGRELKPEFREKILTSLEVKSTVLLSVFLLFDLFAYFSLARLKSWSRRYFLTLYGTGVAGSIFSLFSGRNLIDTIFSLAFYSLAFIMLLVPAFAANFVGNSRHEKFFRFF